MLLADHGPRHNLSESYGIVNSFSMSVQHVGSSSPIHRLEFAKQTSSAHILGRKFSFSCVSSWLKWRNPQRHATSRERAAFCMSSGMHGNETTECIGSAEDCPDLSRFQTGGGKPGKVFNSTLVDDDPNIPKTHRNYSGQGLAEACRFVHNDAKFVNERARNDIVLLSRGLTRLNNRAREDVAILGLKFLKLDARAREDTEKIDHGVKKRAECLHHMAMILKDKAGSKLKRVADQHWSDGALEADLRRADLLVKTRAMKDAYMALELKLCVTYRVNYTKGPRKTIDQKFVKNIHDMMVSRMNELPRRRGFSSVNDVGHIMLEKNGKALDFLTGEISADRITAIQEIYWSMASALSEADGIDYTDPEELEWLVTTLIDLDAMDGKISASLLAECSNSPDVSTRKALANALAAAPSMWTLGNAGMGALQRLAEDSNPAVAAAASKAITELKRQWEIEEGDRLRFTMNPLKADEDTQDD